MARPPFIPTDTQRELVVHLRGENHRLNDIAKVVGISPRTLTRKLAVELAHGHAIATAKVAAALFRAATEGGDFRAQQFWLRCQSGWTEAPIAIESNAPVKVSMTDADRKAIFRKIVAELAAEGVTDRSF